MPCMGANLIEPQNKQTGIDKINRIFLSFKCIPHILDYCPSINLIRFELESQNKLRGSSLSSHNENTVIAIGKSKRVSVALDFELRS